MEHNTQTQRRAAPFHNTVMRDKLKKMIGNNGHNDRIRSAPTLPNVNKIGVEGVDHILLEVYSSDSVGKVLAVNSDGILRHKLLGNFRSLRGFWHYISTEERDDRLRELQGKALEKFSQQLTKTRVQNFNVMILDAIYQKVKSEKESIFLIKKSTLPFDHYKVAGNTAGLRQRMGYSFWLIDGCEEIRNAIKEDREPDFKKHMNTPNISLEEFIRGEFFDHAVDTRVLAAPLAAAATLVEEVAPQSEDVQVPALLSSNVSDERQDPPVMEEEKEKEEATELAREQMSLVLSFDETESLPVEEPAAVEAVEAVEAEASNQSEVPVEEVPAEHPSHHNTHAHHGGHVHHG